LLKTQQTKMVEDGKDRVSKFNPWRKDKILEDKACVSKHAPSRSFLAI